MPRPRHRRYEITQMVSEGRPDLLGHYACALILMWPSSWQPWRGTSSLTASPTPHTHSSILPPSRTGAATIAHTASRRVINVYGECTRVWSGTPAFVKLPGGLSYIPGTSSIHNPRRATHTTIVHRLTIPPPQPAMPRTPPPPSLLSRSQHTSLPSPLSPLPSSQWASGCRCYCLLRAPSTSRRWHRSSRPWWHQSRRRTSSTLSSRRKMLPLSPWSPRRRRSRGPGRVQSAECRVHMQSKRLP